MSGRIPNPGSASNGPPSAEERKTVSRLRELYHGRFSEDGVAALLQHLNWNEREAAKYLFQLRPDQDIDDVRPPLKDILRRLTSTQRDGLDDIKLLIKKGKIDTTERLFACEDCNNEWWRRVPGRKEVSKCKKCGIRYDAIPREFEWGLATFHCEQCGETFTGFGQMNKTESRCYRCSAMVRPSEIRRPDPSRRGERRSRKPHECNACRGGAQAWNTKCAHPRSRDTVLLGSRRHVSTGSTVDTFLTQPDGPKEATVFEPSLIDISEEDDDNNSG